MKPFVLDANVINRFQGERLSGECDLAASTIKITTEIGFIALDNDGHCEAEWLACAAGSFPLALKDWIADMLAAEKIRLYDMNCGSMFQELQKLGLPKKDHKWVRLARSCTSDNIVTDDIDLFDPSMKGCSHRQAIKIKLSGKGKLCRHLKKVYDISVICPENLAEHVS